MIATNIDPQLSHGVESLKTQISELLEEDEDENVIEIVVLKNSGNDNIRLELTGDGKSEKCRRQDYGNISKMDGR